MIEKFIALKMIQQIGIQEEGQDRVAFCLGDQRPTFDTEWLASAAKKHTSLKISDQKKEVGVLKASHFFKYLGYDHHIDFDYNGNASVLADLGKPISGEFVGKADLIFDGGVCEHIPNIYQAMTNIVTMAKKGCYLFQAVPVNAYGDSYYSIDPLLLRDFYELNGFETVEIILYYRSGFLINIKSFIRGVLPHGLVSKIENWVNRNQGAGGPVTKQIVSSDNLREIRTLEPFSKKVYRRANSFGLPCQTHVLYIGIKKDEISHAEIVDPVQEVYPSRLDQN